MEVKDFENAMSYIEKLKNEGNTYEEIVKQLSKYYKQKEIAQLLDVNVRRVKYLYQKYGIKKNDKYYTTKLCMNCGEETHVSNFDIVFENGIPRTSRLCCWRCKSQYNKKVYMNRVIQEHWRQEEIKREISRKEYEIEVLKSLLK